VDVYLQATVHVRNSAESESNCTGWKPNEEHSSRYCHGLSGFVALSAAFARCPDVLVQWLRKITLANVLLSTWHSAHSMRDLCVDLVLLY